MNRLVRAEAGQAVAEAALVLPVLLLILMGIFMVGQWFNAELVVTAAAREGARAGALLGEWQCIANAVTNAVQSLGQKNAPRFAVYSLDHAQVPAAQELQPGDQLPEPGHDIQVVVTYHFTPLFGQQRAPYDTVFTPTSFPFAVARSQATARMEYRPSQASDPQCQAPAG